MAETLNDGDLTTALAKWLDTETLTGTLDKVAVARADLVTHYTANTKDFGYLLARFLNRIAP